MGSALSIRLTWLDHIKNLEGLNQRVTRSDCLPSNLVSSSRARKPASAYCLFLGGAFPQEAWIQANHLYPQLSPFKYTQALVGF